MSERPGVDYEAVKRQGASGGTGWEEDDNSVNDHGAQQMPQPSNQNDAGDDSSAKITTASNSEQKSRPSAASSVAPSAITFHLDKGDFATNVFEAPGGGETPDPITLDYNLLEVSGSSGDQLQVSDATLYTVSPLSTGGSETSYTTTPVASGTYAESTETSKNTQSGKLKRQQSDQINIDDGSFEIPVQPGVEGQELAYFLRVNWNYGSESGNSDSDVFGTSMSHLDSISGNFDLPNEGGSALKQVISDFQSTENQADASPSASNDSDASADADSEESASSSGGGGGGGGLSTAAKAGIGAGVGVVGLAIIGVLLWFFLFRKKNRRKADKGHSREGLAYGHPDAQNSAHMVTKETSGNIADSPRTPYSDDGSLATRENPHATPPHAVYGQQDHNNRQEPPSNRGQSYDQDRDSQREQQRSAGGARSTTPGGGPNDSHPDVSHLIEDGMTEEQIRRLEEEERALDDAIQRAGNRRRGP